MSRVKSGINLLAPVAVRAYREITDGDSDDVAPEKPRPTFSRGNHIRIYQDVIPPTARVTVEWNNNASVFLAESVVDSRGLMLELTIGNK
jgi:hypothetical protein